MNKIKPGRKKTATKTKRAKTASTKMTAIKKKLTTLQKNVNSLLAEFVKRDTKKVKTLIRAKAKKLRNNN